MFQTFGIFFLTDLNGNLLSIHNYQHAGAFDSKKHAKIAIDAPPLIIFQLFRWWKGKDTT